MEKFLLPVVELIQIVIDMVIIIINMLKAIQVILCL